MDYEAFKKARAMLATAKVPEPDPAIVNWLYENNAGLVEWLSTDEAKERFPDSNTPNVELRSPPEG